VRSHRVVLGVAASLLALAGCGSAAAKADSAAPPPVELVEQPAASAGGACILWDYAFIEEKIGVRFSVAAAGQADDTSTCVVQKVAGRWPDLALSVVESTTAGAELFTSELTPRKATKLKDLGRAGYRLTSGARDGHGPTVEIGWLSEAKQLQTLRFTFPAGAAATDVNAMNGKLLALAKAMDTTPG
jgi:hypothetical protein